MTSGSWAAIDQITGAVPAPRRSRAVEGVSRNSTDIQLFQLSRRISDRRRAVTRRTIRSLPPINLRGCSNLHDTRREKDSGLRCNMSQTRDLRPTNYTNAAEVRQLGPGLVRDCQIDF